AIWEWIILLEIAQQCMEDNSINNIYKDNLKEFMENNFMGLKLNMNKVVEVTKKKSINGGLLKPIRVLGSSGRDTKYSHGSYLDYIEDLRENVLKALKGSSNKYTIIFDELDDKFRNEEIYKSSIISLIKISDKINETCFNEGIDVKIILLLRTDIFYILNDPDLNKVEQDGSIKLDWGNTIKSNSPLFGMVLNKVRKSIPELEAKNDFDLFTTLFPQQINYRSPNEFILGRTYFRPRDIVTYLNLIIEKYPETRYFGHRGFLELERNYSTYFFKEIRNELYGHISDEKIDASFLLLKQYKKSEFTYAEIKAYYDSKMSVFKEIDLEESLKYFFNFGVLGNKQFNEEKGKDFYSWAYRENTEIDYDKKFVIHLGLRKELSV
ncbi:P-loop ATPase, Sll1717 family, partial [Enterococcus faecalis]|uniref:P-loop ATPase, Sll1717 family n=1 Tax=Enterococcus faecalis TaxID=1351 RepID=UPI002FDC44B2